ncbi:NADH-quinone oxidoreductase subunit C [Dichotomicrobium thermohalophilum]|uniref:NADH-quinone oxidoreductase subunit C n=1 Tax=Dichotomicrobium thermohalophilum TaxID=933063 RepID=A0A397Q6L5_9HYPH|nr:NADH-quinone oxidoreductase subunit C [Dichotomicrobium thermohalophilum]RIA56109.1 NADH dehydrogenase subunit C [Dichotomicrobium thermohalophilum]
MATVPTATAQEEALQELGEHIAAARPEAVDTWYVALGELTVRATRENIVSLMTFLRDDVRCQFTCLIDICGVDYPDRAKRFEVVYHLLSARQNKRVRVKTDTDEVTPVPSVTHIFPAANWYEREAFDLYGIFFSGHPDLRRILTDYGFQGHPLRKDFPLTGFVEVRYNEDLKRVVYEPVKLQQEYRDFDFISPWEGAEYILPGDEKASSGSEGKT